MSLLDSLPTGSDPLRLPLRMICADLRYGSTARIQQKYPKYAHIEPDTARNAVERYIHEDGNGVTYLNIMDTVNEIEYVHHLLHADLKTPQVKGQLLRRASFAACALGDVATRGDLEFYIQKLEHMPRLPTVIRPRELLEAHDSGESELLLGFLQLLFESSSERLAIAGVDPGANPWIRTSRGWGFRVYAVMINYYLLKSLSAYVGSTIQVAGHA